MSALILLLALAQTEPDLGGGLLDVMDEARQLDSQSVLSTALHPQPIDDVAASVIVITSEDIRRFGYTSLAEILRVAGMWVTNNYDYGINVGFRGVGRRGRFAGDVLFLLDDHPLNELYSNDFYTDQTIGVDLQDVRKVEVLRGPGGALYGANGFLGVVNIVTREATKELFAESRASAGSGGVTTLSAASAKRFANDFSFLLSTRGVYRDGRTFDLPELGGQTHASADRARELESYAKLEWGPLRLQIDYNVFQMGTPLSPYGSSFDSPDNRTETQRGFADLRFQKAFLSNRLQLTVRAFFDNYLFQDFFRYDGVPLNGYTLDGGSALWGGGEVRVAGDIVRGGFFELSGFAGGDALELSTQSDSLSRGYAQIGPLTIPERDARVSGFGQLEATIAHTLLLIAGARETWSSKFKDGFNPRLAAIWRVSSDDTIKLLFNRWLLYPSSYNAFFQDGVSIAPNPGLRPETSNVFELNYRRRFGEWLSAQVSVYYQNATNLVQQRDACFNTQANGQDVFIGLPDASGTCQSGSQFLQAANLGSLRSLGGELGAQLSRRGFSAYTQITVQGTLEQFAGQPEAEPINSPRWLIMAGLAVPVYKQNLFVSAEVEAMAQRHSYPTSVIIPAFAVVDLGLASVKLTEHFDFQAKIQNLLDTPIDGPAIAEDISPITHVPQGRRSFMLMLRGGL